MPSHPRLIQSDITYHGPFRVPLDNPNNQETLAYGGYGLAKHTGVEGLYIGGPGIIAGVQGSAIGEITIPAQASLSPTETNINNLPRAEWRQVIRTAIDLNAIGQAQNGNHIGGLHYQNNFLYATGYRDYDPGDVATHSHFKRSATLSDGTYQGPFRFGTTVVGGGLACGHSAGWLIPIPADWQASFDGHDTLSGLGAISIISRTSGGPAVLSFNLADIGVHDPIPATQRMIFPDTPFLARDCGWATGRGGYSIPNDTPGILWNGTTGIAGGIFVPNTRTLLFFQLQGTGGPWCYDEAATCGDPCQIFQPYKGPHPTRWQYFFLAFDVEDILAASNPYDPEPYGRWLVDLPMHPGGCHRPIGMNLDPVTNRFWISMRQVEQPGAYPIIHQFGALVSGDPPPEESEDVFIYPLTPSQRAMTVVGDDMDTVINPPSTAPWFVTSNAGLPASVATVIVEIPPIPSTTSYPSTPSARGLTVQREISVIGQPPTQMYYPVTPERSEIVKVAAPGGGGSPNPTGQLTSGNPTILTSGG